MARAGGRDRSVGGRGAGAPSGRSGGPAPKGGGRAGGPSGRGAAGRGSTDGPKGGASRDGFGKGAPRGFGGSGGSAGRSGGPSGPGGFGGRSEGASGGLGGRPRPSSGSSGRPGATSGSGRPAGGDDRPRGFGPPPRGGSGSAPRGFGSGPRAFASAPRGMRGGPRMAGEAPIKTPLKGLGGDQVEGRQAVRELLMAGSRRVRDIWMVDGTDDSPILAEIEELAGEAKVPIRRVSKEHLFAEARTESPQGVLAHAAELNDVAVEDLFRPTGGRVPFVLAVDNLTDPQNLGALLRSADGAGVTGVMLPKHRTVHITPSVSKAAAGAIERMPMALIGGLPSAMLQLKEEFGVWFVGLDMDGDSSLYDLQRLATEPLCVIVGAEGSGLSRLVRARCDAVASIPLRGSLASLNASAAGAIAMFELGRHRA